MAIAVSDNAVTKKRQGLFKRGYKSWCENTSAAIRKKLSLEGVAPLSPYELASKLDAVLVNLSDVPGLSSEAINHLSSAGGEDWSAVTVVVGSREIIIVNPSHSNARTVSNIMHELAHILLEHEVAKSYVTPDGFTIRDFDDKQEAEADWLAGSLLLPRAALQQLAYDKTPKDQILEDYGVSSQLFDYRMRMTGVNRQFNRA